MVSKHVREILEAKLVIHCEARMPRAEFHFLGLGAKQKEV